MGGALQSRTVSHALFGIVQGGVFSELRQRSLDELTSIGFDGYAIGGLAVGEPNDERLHVLDHLTHRMPSDATRYLMGVGTPYDLVRNCSRRRPLRLCHAVSQCAQRTPFHQRRCGPNPQCGKSLGQPDA